MSVAADCARLIEGSFSTCMMMSPSSSVGMNDLPMSGNRAAAPTSASSAATMTTRAWPSAQCSSGWYAASSLRTSQGLPWCPPCLSATEASTGMTVSDSSSEAPSANTMVSATGPNSLPSSPCRVKSGRNTIMMMSTPAATGVATSCVARYSMCRRETLRSPWRASMFSTTTTAASTSMPIAIARPPSDIRLADKPHCCMSTKVASADSGRIKATTSAARRLPRNSSSSTSTSTMASCSALVTVPTARPTRLPRS